MLPDLPYPLRPGPVSTHLSTIYSRCRFCFRVHPGVPHLATGARLLLFLVSPERGMVASRATTATQSILAPAAAASTARPNLLFILADDLGWADVGWHRPANYSEAHTPYLDGLVRRGVDLDRHYAFKFCSPSRSSLQTGRNPIHVNVNNFDPIHHNKDDPVSGFSGVPRNMTGRKSNAIRAQLGAVGFASHPRSPPHP